jgi:hypothetical protein
MNSTRLIIVLQSIIWMQIITYKSDTVENSVHCSANAIFYAYQANSTLEEL